MALVPRRKTENVQWTYLDAKPATAPAKSKLHLQSLPLALQESNPDLQLPLIQQSSSWFNTELSQHTSSAHLDAKPATAPAKSSTFFPS
jgi:hypothetical protein